MKGALIAANLLEDSSTPTESTEVNLKFLIQDMVHRLPRLLQTGPGFVLDAKVIV